MSATWSKPLSPAGSRPVGAGSKPPRTLLAEMNALPALNCGRCTKCCTNGAVLPLIDEDPSDYETVEIDGVTCIRQGPHGCIYVKPGVGCTIYERRPQVCRTYDCRKQIMMMSKRDQASMVSRGLFSIELLREGRKRLRLARREMRRG